jgi:hypothetical protein
MVANFMQDGEALTERVVVRINANNYPTALLKGVSSLSWCEE